MDKKARVQFTNCRYPRNKIQDGDWAILIGELIEGDLIPNRNNQFIFKGIVPEIEFFETYKVAVELVQDEQWGIQYNLLCPPVLEVNLNNESEQDKFLQVILTETQFKNLHEGIENPFEAIKNEDWDKLTSVKGIKEATAKKIIDKYKSTIDFSNAYIALKEYKLTDNMIKKLLDNYVNPDILLRKIKTNPYILADEIDGIGWYRADKIALASGIEELSNFRIEAYIKHYLERRAQDGDSWVKPFDVMEGLWEYVSPDLKKEHTKPSFDELHEKGIITWDEEKTFVALSKYYNLESSLAKDFIRIKNSTNEFNCENFEEVVKKIETEQDWEYTTQQLEGIKTVIENQVVVITGCAGSGKSSVANAMLRIFPNSPKGLCALAGRASARLSETTGLQGQTIHRLLSYSPVEGYIHNRNNPVPYEIVLLDETSMVGGNLFHRLSQAIKNGSKFIMLGDDGQLESIGTLNVFRDIMDSGVIPVVRLTEIHRQAKKSAIITESIKVRNGEPLFKSGWIGTEIRGELQDLKLHVYEESYETPFAIMENFKEQYKKYNNNIMDVQIIVPVKIKGDASVHEMNLLAQDYCNGTEFSNSVTIPRFIKKIDYSYDLRVGDKVINKKNNKKTLNRRDISTPIWNGNLGIIKEINSIRKEITIDFEEQGEVVVPKKYWVDIELGYAITVHSMQGSQVKSVIIGIDYSGYRLLTRELLYTAITRAQDYCVICGQSKAICYAIDNSNVPTKQTFLHKFLKDIQQEYEKVLDK